MAQDRDSRSASTTPSSSRMTRCGSCDPLRPAREVRDARASRKLAVFLADTRGKFTFPDGKTEEFTTKTGQTMFVPAGEHLPENLSDQPLELVLVELKTT